MITIEEKNKRMEALKEELLSLQSTMRQSDEHAIKCSKMGLSFATEYPSEYAAYTTARTRYNQAEVELAELEKMDIVEEAHHERMV